MFIYLFLAVSSFALNFNSKVYEMGSNLKTELFKAEVRTTGEGEIKTTEAVFRDAKTNEVVLKEVTKTKSGDLVELAVEQLQTGEKGQVQIKDGSVFFEHVKADGKTKKETEKIKDLPVVSSSNFLMFVQKNWDRLEKEKEIELRLAVWDRAETVGFEMIREKVEATPYGQGVLVKLKPSSFVIAALVKPIQFWFSVDGTKLLMMKGRVGPKQKSGTKWQSLDAEVVYEWVKAP